VDEGIEAASFDGRRSQVEEESILSDKTFHLDTLKLLLHGRRKEAVALYRTAAPSIRRAHIITAGDV